MGAVMSAGQRYLGTEPAWGTTLRLRARILKTPVVTSQVAPTILRALGLDPDALSAVRGELTPELPGL